MATIHLKKPIEHEGQTVTELELDLEGLTGEDMTQAEAEHAVMTGGASSVLELSKAYLMHVAARAAKLPVETIKSLDARDFTRVTMEVQNFLLG